MTDVPALKAAIEQAPARSASSRTMKDDLPPSSKNTFVRVSDAAAMTLRPVAVEPVKEMMSTRGSRTSCSPSA